MDLKAGIKGTEETVVNESNTAKAMGSGSLEVFATPGMVALMEKAACNAICGYLAEGETSVGTLINISHCSATPVGMRVWAESEVTAVDGRKISFSLKAFDECGLIGEGTHERFIVKSDRFFEKTQQKKA